MNLFHKFNITWTLILDHLCISQGWRRHYIQHDQVTRLWSRCEWQTVIPTQDQVNKGMCKYLCNFMNKILFKPKQVLPSLFIWPHSFQNHIHVQIFMTIAVTIMKHSFYSKEGSWFLFWVPYTKSSRQSFSHNYHPSNLLKTQF